MEEIVHYLKSILPFEREELVDFLVLFSEKKIKKNDYFAVEGEYATTIGFVTSGVVRAFYRNREGNEYNKTFFTAGMFMGAYSSLVSNQKNLIHIQCVTDCTVLVASFHEMIALYDQNPKIERFSNIDYVSIFCLRVNVN